MHYTPRIAKFNFKYIKKLAQMILIIHQTNHRQNAVGFSDPQEQVRSERETEWMEDVLV